MWKNGSTAIAVAFARSAHGIPSGQGGDQVAVSKHHALGQPGGPTGVGKGDHVCGWVDPDGWRGRPGGEEQAGERSRARRLAEYEDLLHA